MVEPTTEQEKAAERIMRALAKADRRVAIPLTEADDDHFYGAWHGGPAASGGGPVPSRASEHASGAGAHTRWKNDDEMVAEMEQKWGGQWGDIRKVPSEVRAPIVDEIDGLMSRYGASPNWQGIRFQPKNGSALAEVKRVNPAVPGSAVYLYGAFGTSESVAKAYKSAPPKWGTAWQTGSVEAFSRGIVTHEMGHQYMGLNLHSRLGADRNAPVRKELEPWFHQTFPPSMGKAHISQYARSNPHEAWAELFAAANGVGNSQSHFVPELKAILDKYYPPKG